MFTLCRAARLAPYPEHHAHSLAYFPSLFPLRMWVGSTSSPGRCSCVHALIPLLPFLFLVRGLNFIQYPLSLYIFLHPPPQPQWQAWHDRYGPKVCEQPPVFPPLGSLRTRLSSFSSSSAPSKLSIWVLVVLFSPLPVLPPFPSPHRPQPFVLLLCVRSVAIPSVVAFNSGAGGQRFDSEPRGSTCVSGDG